MPLGVRGCQGRINKYLIYDKKSLEQDSNALKKAVIGQITLHIKCWMDILSTIASGQSKAGFIVINEEHQKESKFNFIDLKREKNYWNKGIKVLNWKLVQGDVQTMPFINPKFTEKEYLKIEVYGGKSESGTFYLDYDYLSKRIEFRQSGTESIEIAHNKKI